MNKLIINTLVGLSALTSAGAANAVYYHCGAANLGISPMEPTAYQELMWGPGEAINWAWLDLIADGVTDFPQNDSYWDWDHVDVLGTSPFGGDKMQFVDDAVTPGLWHVEFETSLTVIAPMLGVGIYFLDVGSFRCLTETWMWRAY